MAWIIFTVIAILLWTVDNIMDKYILDHEVRDPILVTTIFGLTTYALFIGFAVFNGSISLPSDLVLIAVASGLVYSMALWLYYQAMSREEVSRFVPFLSIEPAIVAIAAFILFGERLAYLSYLGILLIIIGAILLAHKKYGDRTKAKKIFAVALAAMALFSLRNILFKYLTASATFWPAIFWFAIGGIIVPLALLIFHHPHIRKKAEKGIAHLLLVALFSAVGLVFFFKAISLGSVSLASALVAGKPLLVFFVATFLSFFYPKIIVERHTRAILVKKALAIALIVVGSIFIVI